MPSNSDRNVLTGRARRLLQDWLINHSDDIPEWSRDDALEVLKRETDFWEPCDAEHGQRPPKVSKANLNKALQDAGISVNFKISRPVPVAGTYADRVVVIADVLEEIEWLLKQQGLELSAPVKKRLRNLRNGVSNPVASEWPNTAYRNSGGLF